MYNLEEMEEDYRASEPEKRAPARKTGKGILARSFYASRISSTRGIFTINPDSGGRQIENRNLTSAKRKQVSSFTLHFNSRAF